jgi:dTDP-glucose 4,6-dehydratase
MKKILVTGGAGFIGSAFIRYMLKTHADVKIVNYDKLTYAGNLENLRAVEKDPRYRFVRGDIGDLMAVMIAMGGDTDTVVNFAAESHNDRGVLDPGIFFRTNVVGTQALLEASKRAGVTRFHHISTDEVFGDLALDENRAWKEDEPKKPRTPYSASKAGSDHLVMAYHHTFGLPVTMSHCCNNYGPYQFPEKLVSLFATNALEDKPLPLFKSSRNSREWIHCDDHSAAVDAILSNGRNGEAYNIGTGVEKTVEDVTDLILNTLNKPQSLKTYVQDRPGLDRRYLLDSTKIRAELGWQPLIPFEKGIADTIAWYRDNREWWERVKEGSYQTYYDMYYRATLGAKM